MYLKPEIVESTTKSKLNNKQQHKTSTENQVNKEKENKKQNSFSLGNETNSSYKYSSSKLI